MLAIGCGTQDSSSGDLQQTGQVTATHAPGTEGPDATEEPAPPAEPSETPTPVASEPEAAADAAPTAAPAPTSTPLPETDVGAVATAVAPADTATAATVTAIPEPDGTVDRPDPIQPTPSSAPLLDVDISEETAAEAALDDDAELVDRLVHLRARDAIKPIFDAKLVSADKGSDKMGDQDLVIGVSIDGEHHAYSVPYLSVREVVNDTVGGKPIAVTW